MKGKRNIIILVLLGLWVLSSIAFYLLKHSAKTTENDTAPQVDTLAIDGLRYEDGADYTFYYPENFTEQSQPEAIKYLAKDDKTVINLIKAKPAAVDTTEDCQNRADESEKALEKQLTSDDDRVTIIESKKITDGCYEHLKLKMGSPSAPYYIHSIQKFLKASDSNYYAATIRYVEDSDSADVLNQALENFTIKK